MGIFKSFNHRVAKYHVYWPQSPAMQALFKNVKVDSPRQSEMLGKLASSKIVSPIKFQKFFERLAIGVDYIYERFGTTVDGTLIVDDGITHLNWNKAKRKSTLVVSRDDIEFLSCGLRFSGSKTTPHSLVGREMTVLLGVEEAYHHYQFETNPKKYLSGGFNKESIGSFDPKGISIEEQRKLRDLPIEKDAEPIVREAAIHFGFWD